MVSGFWLAQPPHWNPSHSPLSGWLGHAPFASRLIEAIRPQTIVELGTHTGYSFFAFCEAVKKLSLDTALYAIDTWVGDTHAGFYDEHVYEEVKWLRDEEYPDAHLLRGQFDEHVETFPDNSIEIIHIDGRHRYEDVEHDYTTWLPKLAPNGVILFHDVAVTEGTFGVHLLWEQLTKNHPTLTFPHGNGLGVLTPKGVPDSLTELLDPTNATRIQALYSVML